MRAAWLCGRGGGKCEVAEERGVLVLVRICVKHRCRALTAYQEPCRNLATHPETGLCGTHANVPASLRRLASTPR